MNEAYNFSNIEASFKQYINSGNKVLGINTVKNYISDLRHFLGWYQLTHKPVNGGNLPATNASYFAKLDTTIINDYITYLQTSNNSPQTVKRRISSLSTFLKFALQAGLIEEHYLKQLKEIQRKEDKDHSELSQPQPTQEEAKRDTISQNQNLVDPIGEAKKSRSLSFVMILLLGIISMAINHVSTSGNILKPTSSPIIAESSNDISRVLNFRGRLSDPSGNPISAKTDVRFKLYTVPTGGRPVYESNACTVYPDVEGNFEVAIGSSTRDINTQGCDKQIPSSVFSPTAPLYLGLTVGTNAEMSPRQQIANVSLADSALRLNGLAIGTNDNNIPYINKDGEISLAADTPSINASAASETFKITSSRSLLLQSGGTGDVTLSASESGKIRFLTGGSELDRMVIAENGNVGIGTLNPAYFKLELGGSIGPAITKTYNLGAANRLWNTLYVNRICFDEQEKICTTGISGAPSQTQATSAAVLSSSLASTPTDLLVGGTSTSSANIKLSGSTGNPSFIRSGYLGINIPDPQSALDVLGTARFGGNTIDITTQSDQDLTLTANGSGIIRLDDSTVIGANLSGGVNVTSGTTTLDIGGTATTHALCHSSQSGTDDQQIVDCAGTPTADFAEMYPVSEGADYGDIMTLSSQEVKTNEGQYIRKLVASTKPYDNHIIGVVSNNYGDFISVGHNLDKKDNPMPIALKGRVPVKVAADSKPIRAGDFLTSSLEPGKASKAIGPGVMIGRALEDWDPLSGKNQVMVFVNTAYADPRANSGGLVEKLQELVGSMQSPINTSEKIISPIIETDSLIAKEVRTSVIKPKEKDVTIDLSTATASATPSKLVINGEDNKEVASVDARGNASFSGTLSADTIEAKNIKDMQERLASAVEKTTYEQDINAIQSVLGSITQGTLPDPALYQPAPNNIQADASLTQLLDSLTVMGDTNLFNLNVHEKIYSLKEDLQISALASITFLDGAIVMTREGNITAKGTLTAAAVKTKKLSITDPTDQEVASIDASGGARFTSLSLASQSTATPSAIIASQKNFEDNGILMPAIETKSDSAGVGLIPQEEPEVAIYNDKLTPNTLIFLTPIKQATTAAALSVAKKVTCESAVDATSCKPYFTVSAGTNTHSDIYFNWFILNNR